MPAVELRRWIQNLAEHKRIDKTLLETNEYLQNLLNYANAPIIVWNPDFRITRFNHAFEYLKGYKEEEVIGQRLNILFPDKSMEESLNKIEHTLKYCSARFM